MAAADCVTRRLGLPTSDARVPPAANVAAAVRDNPPKDEANDSSRRTLTKEDEAALRSLGYIE